MGLSQDRAGFIRSPVKKTGGYWYAANTIFETTPFCS